MGNSKGLARVLMEKLALATARFSLGILMQQIKRSI
eukprot:CAMPEP_0202949004 /NCGR_PEP_ID=MMETSP1395-20130829/14849_1 /ASSEMBLY_ACC=CAM_ASM_000871 /TAXON_ID=5961 /ORGANISM="Blepharisma japonicum, Strain Stock R1072" /LENGTH=35 /DNA_ID= /DNA_START= /DNA_END= /DNA_ORIENTATION=